MKNVISKEEAERICKSVFSVADFCRAVGWKPQGSNYLTFYKYVKEYGLDTSHFTGQKTNIGNKNNVGLSQKDFFKEGKIKKGSDLIRKLISLGIKEYKCENPECGIHEWHGKEIKLQIHHIDGNHFNNSVENLQLLCPNCHSQTDTYAGKKNKNSMCTRIYKCEPKNKCSVCGKKLHKKTKSGMCIECYRKAKGAHTSKGV